MAGGSVHGNLSQVSHDTITSHLAIHLLENKHLHHLSMGGKIGHIPDKDIAKNMFRTQSGKAAEIEKC